MTCQRLTSAVGLTARFLFAQTIEPSFEQFVKPFLKQNCQQCHNAETSMSGIRVDQLDATLEDSHIRVWEGIRKRVGEGSMPPKDMPQPVLLQVTTS